MMVRTEADAKFINNRRTAMMFYAWGLEDSGARKITMPAIEISEVYALCALNYREERVSYLPSVQDYWNTMNPQEG